LCLWALGLKPIGCTPIGAVPIVNSFEMSPQSGNIQNQEGILSEICQLVLKVIAPVYSPAQLTSTLLFTSNKASRMKESINIL
jgi:hypothetical protein